MPHSPLHQRRQIKNWTVMAMVGGFAFLVFIVTIIKMMVTS